MKKIESISDVSMAYLSAIDLYDALAVIPISRLQDALAAESLGFTVGPQLAIVSFLFVRNVAVFIKKVGVEV